MAQRLIRIDEDIYEELHSRAETQGRSTANLGNYYLRKEFGWLPESSGELPVDGPRLKLPPAAKKPGSVRPVVLPQKDQERYVEAHISSSRFGQGVCKIHQTPFDRRGRCTQKGCKFA